MNKTIEGVVCSLAFVLGAVTLVGCGVETSAKQDDEAMGAMAEELASTGSTGGNGFICGPLDDGGTGCMCWEGEAGTVYSCEGMLRFCDLIGPGMTCDPFEHTCSCRTWIVNANPVTPKTHVVIGTSKSTTKLATP